ncbi:MAG: hypothetical protein Q7J29_11105 [Stagnimonas sp.]|nr:hypothetical protein [Stagnimonas sp.]
MGRAKGWGAAQTGQPVMHSPGRPGIIQREAKVAFWNRILIDRINPFEAAYSVLAKAMDEKSLRQVQASIAAKKTSMPFEEAKEMTKRAVLFKKERGRNPDISSPDAWEKKMAEGVAAYSRYVAQMKAEKARQESGDV